MADVNDIELLQQYDRQGSEEAFAEVVKRHIGLVHSAALRHVGTAAHAEEITQAVFIILARKAASLRPGTVLEGWLYETTRLTASSFRRGERRRQHREQEAYMQSTLNEPADAPAWTRLAPLLDEAMSRLGRKDREAVLLRYFKEKKLGEVASAMRVTEAAAQTRVHRAVEKLRRFFVRRGVVLTTAAIAAAIAANSVQAAPAALTKTITAVAVTKGAAASVSTLTIIKGALKLMAWAKAKTAVLTAVILMGAGAGVLTIRAVDAARGAAAPEIQGAWEGVAPIGGPGVQKGDSDHTRIVLRIQKTNSVYSGAVDVVDLGIKDLRLTRVVYDYPTLRLELPWTSFELTVGADGAKLISEGQPVLERTNAPDAVPERFTEPDYAPRAGSDLQGCWAGLFDDAVWVYWKISEAADGTFRGELDNPAIGENHKPFSVAYSRPKVTLTVLYGTGIFEGDINRAHMEITGTWLQRGKYEPVTLKRVDYHPEPAPPESEYAFHSKMELQGHWKADLDLRLAGRLMNLGQLKEFPVNLDIAKRADGTYAAALAMPLTMFIGMGDPAPATKVQYEAPDLRAEWAAAKWVFAAKLEGGKLAGNLRLGDSSLPLSFERRR
jgi:RNA polymerase sigma factor (sigma-70 family)